MIISHSKRAMLHLLAEVWEHSPDMRLGHLFADLGDAGEDHFQRGLAFIEDDEMMAVLARHLAELKAALPGPLFPAPVRPGEPAATPLA